jgi:hypothetical protein
MGTKSVAAISVYRGRKERRKTEQNTFTHRGGTMKLSPYKEILKWSKEKIDESLAGVRAHKAKKQAELEIAKLDESIATKEAHIKEVCSDKEIDFGKLIQSLDELALMERKRKQFQKIISELFPDD